MGGSCDWTPWPFTRSGHSLKIGNEVQIMTLHSEHDAAITRTTDNPLTYLGTPVEMRTANPIPPESSSLREQGTPKMPYQPMRPRRHGFKGFLDSIAYAFQWTILSLFGAAELSREKDPIEQLKRRYGREPRKY